MWHNKYSTNTGTKRGCSKIKCYGPLFMEFSKMKKAAIALQIRVKNVKNT